MMTTVTVKCLHVNKRTYNLNIYYPIIWIHEIWSMYLCTPPMKFNTYVVVDITYIMMVTQYCICYCICKHICMYVYTQ